MLSDKEVCRLIIALISYASSLGCPPHESEDLVHNSLLKALEKDWLETSEQDCLPLFKRIIKNQLIDNKRKVRFNLIDDTELLKIADHLPTQEGYDPLLNKVQNFLENHPYGYLIKEQEKRGVHTIKALAPYLNEKAENLYNRYQKLLKDLKAELKREGYTV